MCLICPKPNDLLDEALSLCNILEDTLDENCCHALRSIVAEEHILGSSISERAFIMHYMCAAFLVSRLHCEVGLSFRNTDK